MAVRVFRSLRSSFNSTGFRVMPRFTPWHSGVPCDPSESDELIHEVLRPGLRQAFPLPEPDQDERFRILLDALAHLTTDERLACRA